MDRSVLIEKIVEEARKDTFNWRGRVFFKDLHAKLGVSEDEIIEALKDVPYETQIQYYSGLAFIIFNKPKGQT